MKASTPIRARLRKNLLSISQYQWEFQQCKYSKRVPFKSWDNQARVEIKEIGFRVEKCRDSLFWYNHHHQSNLTKIIYLTLISKYVKLRQNKRFKDQIRLVDGTKTSLQIKLETITPWVVSSSCRSPIIRVAGSLFSRRSTSNFQISTSKFLIIFFHEFSCNLKKSFISLHGFGLIKQIILFFLLVQ